MTALRRILDVDAIAAFLRGAPVENAYMLGYLDPSYAEETSWYCAEGHGEISAIVLVYTGLRIPILFTAGRADGITPLIMQFRAELPERALGRIRASHIKGLSNAIQLLTEPQQMSRMGLSRSEFHARDITAAAGVVPITHRDTGDIYQLYAHWPDHLFEPYQLNSGLYFGVREDNKLVAAAGIHNLSTRYDVAAIGNLVTHPEYRGRGLARRCNSALLVEVFKHVGLVTLDVATGNTAAIRTYQHFGFQHYADFYQGMIAINR